MRAAPLELAARRGSGVFGLLADVWTVEVDLHEYRLAPVVARTIGEHRAATVKRLAQRSSALAIVNANFFLPNRAPLGLVVERGVQRNPLRRADWGVFYVDERGRAGVVHTGQWRRRPVPHAEVAVQAGPRLVVQGKVLHFRPGVARRTAVCVRDPKHVILVATGRPVALGSLAEWLAAPRSRGGLGCRDALNLDGGSSTQMFAGGQSVVESDEPVPVGLGVWPR